MMLDSLLGIEELIVRKPGMLARLGEPGVPISNYELAKTQKVFWDYFDIADEDQQDLARPFFVLEESEVTYQLINEEELLGVCAIDVTYTEEASSPTDHKASKLYFLTWISALIDWIAANQNQPIAGQLETTYIAVSQIQMVQKPVRAPKSQRDPDRAKTDFWWCKFRCFVGDLRGAG